MNMVDFSMTAKMARLNYFITIATLANLAFVTISVWLFPKVWIFQITSTTAWILIAIQYYISRKLHRWHLEDLR